MSDIVSMKFIRGPISPVDFYRHPPLDHFHPKPSTTTWRSIACMAHHPASPPTRSKYTRAFTYTFYLGEMSTLETVLLVLLGRIPDWAFAKANDLVAELVRRVTV